MPPPRWIEPQLSKLATAAPTGPQWVHEIKFDGYRMAARIDIGDVRLLTRSGLDWTAKYSATAAAFAKLKVKTAYIDGELSVSKRADLPYLPGDRGAWVKSKCLNRAEFVVVGWSDPEGSRPLIGALLLGYYEPDGRLVYAGRVGTGMPRKTLQMLHDRLRPLAIPKMPLAERPPRKQRFGGPLALSKVHWVRPELVAEITNLTWSDDGLLRHTVYVGLREDKPAAQVRREVARER